MENVYIPGSRIFIGNLASDRISERQVRDIFSRYGRIKDVVVRKGFGFVQYENAEAAQKAIEGENGQVFYGYRLGERKAASDKPRTEYRTEPRTEYRDQSRDRDGRGRARDLLDVARDSRKRSRSRDWNDDRPAKRAHIERHVAVCRVLYDTALLRSLAMDLCAEVERVVRSAGGHIATEYHHITFRELDAELRSLERHQQPYVCVLRESYSANIRDFRLRRKEDYYLDFFHLDFSTDRYKEQRDTDYEQVCEQIAEREVPRPTTNTAQLALLNLLAQLQPQPSPVFTQPVTQSLAPLLPPPLATPQLDVTALLAQLAPLLNQATAVNTPVNTATPARPVNAPNNAQLSDLNGIVQQLIQNEITQLTAPTAAPTHELLASLLKIQQPQPVAASVSNNASNTSGLLAALQSLLNK